MVLLGEECMDWKDGDTNYSTCITKSRRRVAGSNDDVFCVSNVIWVSDLAGLFSCYHGNDVTVAAGHFRPLFALKSKLAIRHVWINPDYNNTLTQGRQRR